MNKDYIPCPKRMRDVRASTFGWIDHRFLKDGFLQQLSGEALRLYVFLILVANKTGTSWYSYDRICSLLNMDVDTYLKARQELLRYALIAYDNGVFQVLSMPTQATHMKTAPTAPARAFCRAEDFRSLKNVLSQLAKVDH